MTFIQQDMINNVPLYFELNDQNRLVVRSDININRMIMNRLQTCYSQELGRIVRSVNLVKVEDVNKPGVLGINTSVFDNVYRIVIQVQWIHKSRIRKYQTGFYITSYSLKRITTRQMLNENSTRVDLPDIRYSVMHLILTTQPPSNPTVTHTPPTTTETSETVSTVNTETFTSNDMTTTTNMDTTQTTMSTTFVTTTTSSTTTTTNQTTDNSLCKRCGGNLCRVCNSCPVCDEASSCSARGGRCMF